MSYLETMAAHKRREVAERRSRYPIALLEESIYFKTEPVSLRNYLLRKDRIGVIAEIKRRSPSRGPLNPYINVEQISIGYMQAGASALSVLTDLQFFGGTNEDLTIARKFNYCPILRKDFIVDEYQIIEAKSIGADALLLIAAMLEVEVIAHFTQTANSLGLEVMLEIHSEHELDKLLPGVALVGVNNRDLATLDVCTEVSFDLADRIPSDYLKVSESGIATPEVLAQLRLAGYHGFLIGERFMSHSRPEKACAEFIKRTQLLLPQEILHED